MDSNTIYHHGIKGMKWGVRRYQNKDGTLTNAGKARLKNNGVKEKRKTDSKNRRTLSETEIKRKIERLKLERQLKDLTDEDVSPGKKFVKDVLSASGKKVLTTAAAGTMAYLVKSVMTKEFNVKEAANYIASNPNKKK